MLHNPSTSRNCRVEYDCLLPDRDDLPEREVHVVALVNPGRLAPACGNPSAAAYGDCGDDPEYEVESMTMDGVDCDGTLSDAEEAYVAGEAWGAFRELQRSGGF